MKPTAPESVDSGRYRLQAPLGDGGMASVYRAWDERLRVWRAVKLLRPELAHNAAARQRFDQEARAMARLQHPHILAVHDVGQEGNTPFLVMDLAPGGSLADRVAHRGPMHPALACRLAEELLRALAHAHAEGVIHRDVKPHNVLIASDGRALVSDFGIARVLDSEAGLTRTGATVGTLAYMAPEQRGSASKVDGKADVYAAGGTLYHLLTGREPLDLYVTREGAFDRVPAELIGPIEAAVRYLPAERPTAAELADQIAAIRPSLGEVPQLDVEATPAPQERRTSETWAAGEGTFGATSGFGTADESLLFEAPPDPPPARGRSPAWWIAPPGLAALGLATWWLTTTASTGPVVLDRWTASAPVDAPSPQLHCGPGGQLAWLGEGQLYADLEGPSVGPADGAAFDPAGGLWTLTYEPEAITARRGDQVRRFPFRADDVDQLALGPDGRRAVGYGTLGIQWSEGDQVHAVSSDQSVLGALSPDGERLAVIQAEAASYTLAVVDLGTGRRVQIRDGRGLMGTGHVGVAWMSDGRVAWLETDDAGTLAVMARDPDTDGPVSRLFEPDPATVVLLGAGNHLCAVATPRRSHFEVVDSQTFQEEYRIDAPDVDTIVAGWIDDERVQLFAGDQSFWLWTLPTGVLTQDKLWERPRKPESAFPKLQCEGTRCIGLEEGPRGLRVIPVDPETGVSGAPWPASLPVSGNASWDLSEAGTVAIVAVNDVHLVNDQGARSIGRAGLDQVYDVEWAPDGSLWVMGELGSGSGISRWNPGGHTVLRSGGAPLTTPVASPDGRRAVMRVTETGALEVTIYSGEPDPG